MQLTFKGKLCTILRKIVGLKQIGNYFDTGLHLFFVFGGSHVHVFFIEPEKIGIILKAHKVTGSFNGIIILN